MSPIPREPLRAFLAGRYELPAPIAITLIRSHTNGVFLVRSADDRSVLKVYGSGWRTEPEIRYEVGLLDHLAAMGVPATRAISGRDGEAVQPLGPPAAPRLAVLYSYAPGATPEPPFTADLYETEGRATAALHTAADGFVSEHERRRMDLVYLLDRPAALVAPLIGHLHERRFFARFVEQLRRAIADLADRDLDWGPCHGDLTLDNFHLTADGRIVRYDFDSGGPDWRAGDLQGWAAFHPRASEKWAAFLRGYRDVRSLDPVDVAAAPYLAAAFDVWEMAVDLENRVT